MALIEKCLDVLVGFEQFLHQFDLMAHRLRTTPSTPGLAAKLHQIKHARGILEDRRRDLELSLKQADADRFVHELWSLGAGDLPRIEIDFSGLPESASFNQLRQDLSMRALLLTRELAQDPGRAQFEVELRSP